jgi:hypothetical protein
MFCDRVCKRLLYFHCHVHIAVLYANKFAYLIFNYHVIHVDWCLRIPFQFLIANIRVQVAASRCNHEQGGLLYVN